MSKNESQMLRAELEALRAENERLKHRPVTFKVSPKGGVSVYGLGRFPVTLYVEQWERLLSQTESLQAFLAAHEAELTRKAA